MRQEQPNLASSDANKIGSSLINSAVNVSDANDLDPLDEWAQKEAALEEGDF